MLKKLVSVLMIITMAVQWNIYSIVSADANSYKDPYKELFIADADGSDKFLPVNFSIRAQDQLGLNTSTGHYVSWENVSFDTAPVAVELTYATLHKGVEFELRLDSSVGLPIASFKPEPTGTNMYNISKMRVDVSRTVTGVHTLYAVWKNSYLNMKSIVFFGKGEDNTGYAMYDGYQNEQSFDDLSSNDFAYEITLLNQLGMLDFTDGAKFDKDKMVTRGEFAQSLCSFYTDDVPDGNMCFYDLPANHSKAKYVNYLYSIGLIDMTRDGYFRPDSNISVDEALDILIKIFDYQHLKEYFLPQGRTELENSIMSGIELKSRDSFTRQDLAMMLYHATEASYITTQYNGKNSPGYRSTKGVLYKTRNMNKIYGVVTAIPSTSLSSSESGLSAQQVMIDDTVFSDKKEIAKKFLGYDCVVYYEDAANGDEKELKAIYPRKNVSETVIDTTKDDELREITQQQIEYYNADSRKKSIRFSGTSYFIYNGKAIDDSLDRFVQPESFRGRIRVIKNNNCTVSVIDEYQNALITAVDTGGRKYLDKISDVVIDTSEDNTAVYKDGKAIANTDITTDSAAVVYRSKNKNGEKITAVYIQPEVKVTGMINRVDDEYIVIEETKYRLAKENKCTLTAGMFGDFTINGFNEIIWYEPKTNESMKVAIYLDYQVNNYALDDKIVIKLFTEDNQVEIVECASKMILDGVMRKETEALIDGTGAYEGLKNIEKKTPVMYLVNTDNKLMALDTYQKGSEDRFDILTKVNQKGTFRFLNGPRILVERSSGLSKAVFESGAKLMSFWAGSFSDDEECSIETFANQIHSTQYVTGQAYSTKGKENVADIFVWENRDYVEDGGNETNFILVNDICTAVDEDGDTRRAISGYSGSKQVNKYISESLSAEETQKIDHILQNLQCGDYIKLKFDRHSDIKNIEVMYFYDGVADRNGVGAALYKDGAGNYRKSHDNILSQICILGKAVDLKDNFITIQSGENGNPESYALREPGAFRHHTRGIEKGLLLSEVFRSEQNGDNVLVLVLAGYVSQIIIYE